MIEPSTLLSETESRFENVSHEHTVVFGFCFNSSASLASIRTININPLQTL
jgi:hypothetical protein